MKLRFAFFAVAVVLAACGTESTSTPVDQSTQDSKEIIGGFDARAKVLDAVGTVGTIDDSGNYSFFCTATLITPDTVLTARHCAMVIDTSSPLYGMKLVNLIPIYFAVGADATKPAKVVEAIAADLSPVDQGGWVAMGNDVAVYHLIQPITDDAPIKVATGALAATDVNKGFAMVGYGSKDNYEDLTGYLSSTRATGKATLRALEGKDFELMYGNYETFFKFMVSVYGLAIATEYEDVIRGWYDGYKVLSGYEAYTGHVAGDAQACHGDSGGPLLGREKGEKAIFGVASGVFFSSQLTCDMGTFYGTIGAETQTFIKQAVRYTDPCGHGLTAAGYCDGDVAIRCSDKWEGDRRVTELDCSLLDQKCSVGASGRVGCGDDSVAPHAAAPTVREIRTAIVHTSHKPVMLPKK